jgi:8-oxo-dGTP pyrophosphatase MutT (NUDIX family)
MKNNKNQQILIGGAVLFRDNHGKKQFLLVKQKDGDGWEIPKVTVRRGESSVRAVIRLISEQGEMNAKVFEEVGRLSGSSVINSKPVSQKYYYYLMFQKGGKSELIGFDEFKWLDYSVALEKITSKKEKDMFKTGREVLKEWEKTHNLKKQEVEEF